MLSASLASSPAYNVWRNPQALLFHFTPVPYKVFFLCAFNKLYRSTFKQILQSKEKRNHLCSLHMACASVHRAALDPQGHHNQELLGQVRCCLTLGKDAEGLKSYLNLPSIGAFRLSAAFVGTPSPASLFSPPSPEVDQPLSFSLCNTCVAATVRSSLIHVPPRCDGSQSLRTEEQPASVPHPPTSPPRSSALEAQLIIRLCVAAWCSGGKGVFLKCFF